jgi:hypothetical protein
MTSNLEANPLALRPALALFRLPLVYMASRRGNADGLVFSSQCQPLPLTLQPPQHKRIPNLTPAMASRRQDAILVVGDACISS